MLKTTFALVAMALIATSSAFAGDKAACCANASGKMECSAIYAKLNLTAAQKTKLDSLQADCEKTGCTEESMQKYLAGAKSVLSPEQYSQLKSECMMMKKHTPKSSS